MTNIQSVLRSPYNREAYMGLLHEQFNVNQLRKSIQLGGNGVKSLEQLGLIHISDEKRLPIFEAHINPETQLHRNRVGLRNVIAREINQREEEGALAVYLNERDRNQWRLSLVSIEQHFDEDGNLTATETDSRRYTYLLGKDAKIRTATEQLAKLNKESSLEDFKNAFSVEALNKEFYTKLHKWYDDAKNKVFFPNDEKRISDEEHTALSLIRLLTRLLFVWFIKEKNMVDNDLFDPYKLQKIICWDKPGSFYKAILQNLFFATLNCPIQDRAFRTINGNSSGTNDLLGSNLYRYQDCFQWDSDSVIHLFAKTPFLNGGLFECLDREQQGHGVNQNGSGSIGEIIRSDCFSDSVDNPINVPNELFFNDDRDQPGLINLLSQYQFTVEESTPLDVEVALDPELMGQIFENLLADYNPETRESARKNTGSYYTPRHIVDYMVTESLKLHLKQALLAENEGNGASEEKLKKLFRGKNEFDSKQTEILIKSIDELRILDPAVGSGAFPMGILQRLVGLLETLDPENQQFKQRQLNKAKQIEDIDIRQRTLDDIESTFSEKNDYNNYGRKLYLIKNVIFGVDIQPIAIHIAKLRFFISLAIEQGFDKRARGENYGVQALPNMEVKFVSADSLIPLSDMNSKQLTFGDDRLAELKEQLFEIRSNYFHATGEDRKEECRRKDKLIREEIEKALRRNDLYSESDTRNSAGKIGSWDPYNQTSIATWFDSEYTFGIRDGFDVVIGNPPYIPLSRNSGRLAKYYKDAGFETHVSSGDIYQLFYEKACSLLKLKQGILSYITSNSWLRATSGELTRSYLSDNHTPLKLLEIGKDVFENATVDVDILMLRHSKSDVVCKGVDMDYLPSKHFPPDESYWNQVYLEGKKPWSILPPVGQRIKEKMEEIGTPLADLEWDISIYYGIKTGLNKDRKTKKGVFIIDNETKEELIREDPKSAELIKPVLRGRDIQKYKTNWDGWWLITTFPSLKLNIEFYPAIKKHLLSFGKERLEQASKTLSDGTKSRKKTPHAWYELQDTCAYYEEFSKEKLVWIELVEDGRFAYDKSGIYCEATCFILTGEHIKYLSALLNAKLIRWFFSKVAPTSGMGTLRWKKAYVENIPIPKISAKEQEPLIRLVNKILSTKAADSGANTRELEIEIDHLVYGLFRLKPQEISFIESTQK